MTEGCGVVYIGTGERIVKEILRSAASLKEIHPDIRITVFSDREIKRPDLFETERLIVDPQYGYIDKILPLTETPYNYTLYLDSDTIVVNQVSAIFELLDQFDLAVALEPKPKRLQYPTAVPVSFPEYNTGVFAYRKNEANLDLFKRWYDLYLDQKSNVPGTTHDQPAFREALYHSPIRFTTLPSQYNLRTLYLTALSRNIETTIVHHRAFDMKRLPLLRGTEHERIVCPDPFVLDSRRLVILGRGGNLFQRFITTLTAIMRFFRSPGKRA